MIYFFYGNDREKVKISVKKLIEGLLKKKPDASFFLLNQENFSFLDLENYIGGQGLFQNKYIVHLEGFWSEKKNKEVQGIIENRLKEIKNSPNIFIISEFSITEKVAKAISKYSEKTESFIVDILEKEKSRNYGLEDGKRFNLKDFNIFLLGDYLASKNKKKLWTMYVQTMQMRISGEEVCGIFFWQIKSLILTSKAKTPAEAGISPYVFYKSKNYINSWNLADLLKISSKLVKIYHESRLGKDVLSVALEKFILELK